MTLQGFITRLTAALWWHNGEPAWSVPCVVVHLRIPVCAILVCGNASAWIQLAFTLDETPLQVSSSKA